MKRQLFASLGLAAVLALLARPIHAAVFERDWKTPGDGLLTYDDVNNREWLDLSVSRLDRFPEPRLENAVAEIQPGGLFEGFRWARSSDAVRLVQSAGIDTSTRDYSVNGVYATQLINLLGPTVQTPFTIRSVGLLDQTHYLYGSQLGVDIYVTFLTPQAGVFVPSLDDFVASSTNGLMLYRTVPEPWPVLLAVEAVWLLVFFHARMRAA